MVEEATFPLSLYAFTIIDFSSLRAIRVSQQMATAVTPLRLNSSDPMQLDHSAALRHMRTLLQFSHGRCPASQGAWASHSKLADRSRRLDHGPGCSCQSATYSCIFCCRMIANKLHANRKLLCAERTYTGDSLQRESNV